MDKTLLPSNDRLRFQEYASKILEGIVYSFLRGMELSLNSTATTVVNDDEDDEDDDDAYTYVYNPFELYAYVTREEGFTPPSDSEELTTILSNVQQLAKDAQGWYYVPLGDDDLEFVPQDAWQHLYRTWLLRRAAKKHNRHNTEPHQNN